MILGSAILLVALAQEDAFDPALYRFPAQAVQEKATERANERAYLGIRPGEETEEGEGIVLAEVVGGGPADQAGIRAGDRILRVGEEEVKGSADLTAQLEAHRPGDDVSLVVERAGTERTFRVTLGGRSASGTWRKPEFRLGIVLFEFADARHHPRFTRDDFHRMLFSRGEYIETNPSGERVYGSLADYYWENSTEKLSVTGKVFDWIELEDSREYFEERPMGDREASRRLFPKLIDLLRRREGENRLDEFDGLVFVYAGKQTYHRLRMLWPHRASVRVGKRSLPYYLTAEGGKRFNAINVHVHEFGHMLGLPDQYGRKHATGIGKWCTMSVGHMGGGKSRVHRPFHLCLWCKEQLGWVRVTTIRPSETQALKLTAIERDPSMAFRIRISDGEAYLLENRQRSGFDSDLDATGLLLWHVRRGRVDLIESHGRKVSNASLVEPEEIPWPSFYNRDFTPETTPPASGLYLTGITERDGVVYFRIGTAKSSRSVDLEKRQNY